MPSSICCADQAFTASGLSGFASGWFTFGTLDWTSGANAGRRTEVLGHDVTDGIAVLTLLEAPVRAIAEVTLSPSARAATKRIETCSAKFANTASFQGFPHIPGQDARSCAMRRRTVATTGACWRKPPIRTRSSRRRDLRLGTPYHDQASLKGVGCTIVSGSPGVSGATSWAPSLSRSRYSRDEHETGPREVLAEGARHT